MTKNAKIKPYTVQIPQIDLDDLAERLDRTRWTAPLPATSGNEWARGVPQPYLRELVEYWREHYDWRKAEAEINTYPQFTTMIDGLDVHFLHVRSPEPDALPLLLTHGWPGSFVEFLDVIGPLTDPKAHGGDPADAFHVVIPSVPGFGFSGPITDSGWTAKRVAHAWAELMHRLGYDRYGAQGGDIGAIVGPEVGRVDGAHVIGVHVNAASIGFIPLGPVAEEDLTALTDAERARLERIEHFTTEEWGYNQLQSTRPETLGYALGDSPVGQLAWIVEKFKSWTASAAALPEQAVDRERMLTNITLYWLTGTAGTSANIYYEGSHTGEWEFPVPSGVPTGVGVFGEDVSIRRFAERSNTITYWAEYDQGGHFAAMETPDLLVEDVRLFFRTVR